MEFWTKWSDVILYTLQSKQDSSEKKLMAVKYDVTLSDFTPMSTVRVTNIQYYIKVCWLSRCEQMTTGVKCTVSTGVSLILYDLCLKVPCQYFFCKLFIWSLEKLLQLAYHICVFKKICGQGWKKSFLCCILLTTQGASYLAVIINYCEMKFAKACGIHKLIEI